MFVWIGLSLENELFNLTQKIIKYSNDNNIITPLKDLPIHVSLRMSFEIEKKDFNNIEGELTQFSSSLSPFKINFKYIEANNNIIWIKCEETNELLKAHDTVCNILKDKFNVPLHAFDKEFVFHSTLFMDDPCKIQSHIDNINKINLPDCVISNTVLIGTSESGEPGTYKIYKTIKI